MPALTADLSPTSINAKVQRKERIKGRRDFEEKMMIIEAALYVAGRPLDLKTLCSIAGSRSEKKIHRIARILVEEYKRRNTALEVLELEDHRFVMQLKSNYSDRVRRLAIRPLLTAGPLRTLSYIAYKQPVTQKQVVEVRGKHAYQHIRELAELGLITRERNGKDFILRTTDYFADYFGLSRSIQIMKRQLERIFKKHGEETLPLSLEEDERREMSEIEKSASEGASK
ncbi:MAG: SMC-Scp complex subunit ScpB [Candidatus Bathyarchaeota archaeon]|nr:SMC-Scp complex subunit ScpB [Candidatus Bathyarchaeota archaeon]